MNPTVVDNKKPARYGSVITADAAKDGIPSRIEVMRAGSWPENNNKGRALTITTADLNEFANNFKAGIGVPGGKAFGQIPIDFSHADGQQAAGWITNLEVDGTILYADVNWTAAGVAALEGGMFKCFSPSFWPACLGEYPDPENHNITAKNVLVGGGLTNIPFFKDLTAIMASKAGNSLVDNNNKGAVMLTFDEARIKDVASLTADDKKVLADNQADMSTEETTKFAEVLAAAKKAAMKTPPTPDDTDGDGDKDVDVDADDDKDKTKGKGKTTVDADAKVTGLNTDDAKLLADLKSGKYKMIEATQYDAMTSTVEQLKADNEAAKEREITASVAEHVKRGAIKADQAETWVKRVVADSTMADLLKDLPSNQLLATEVGSGVDGTGLNATSDFNTKVDEVMKADSKLTYSQAVTKVANDDAALANSVEAELKK